MRDVLLVDSDEHRPGASQLLTAYGFHVTTSMTVSAGIELATARSFDAIVVVVDPEEVPATRVALRELKSVGMSMPAAVTSQLDPEDVLVLARPLSSEALLEALAERFASLPVHRSVETIIRTYFACLERAEWDRLGSLCAPSFIYYLPGLHPRFSRTVRGRDGFLRFAADTFGQFAEPRFVVTSIRALPKGYVVRYEGSWVANGERVTMPGTLIMKIENELIETVGVRLDLQELHRAVS